MAEPFDPQSVVKNLPLLPGVYRFLDEQGQVLYVGKAKQLKKRVKSYFQSSNIAPRIRLMVSHIAAIETTVTHTEMEALLLENTLIKSLKPRYNILFRDDKSYPYIMLTADAYPRLAYYRGAPGKRHQYFGPYPNANAAREAMHLLQKIFKLRTCENSVFNHRERACLLHQIQRCSAPCVELISASDYRSDITRAAMLLQGKHGELEAQLTEKMQQASDNLEFEQAGALRDQLRALQTVRQKQCVESTGGVADVDIIALAQQEQQVCVSLSMVRAGRHLGDKSFFPEHAQQQNAAQVLYAFITQHYVARAVPPLVLTSIALEDEALPQLLSEQAGKSVKITHNATAERKQWLLMGLKNAELALQQHLARQGGQRRRLQRLRDLLKMPDLQRIECFDISHTMGEATQASCVVFDDEDMQNAQYRRYNIQDITPGDDYAAMKQALIRRYQKLQSGDGNMPDLVLIDGGRGQLNAALEVINELGLVTMKLIGVAKGEQRKAGLERLVFPEGDEFGLSPDDAALHLIQQVRDEAHRFAITGHRAKRGKVRTISRLEEIEGVGDKRRRNLLVHFGGLREVMQASVDQLAQVQGISRALAEKIYQQLH